MFSGTRALGQTQDMANEPTVDEDVQNDIDFISVKYLSPDSSYPPQRISNYDEQLVQHETLNGVGISRRAAPFMTQMFLTRHADVAARTRTGAPRGAGRSTAMVPRFVRL